MKIGWIIALMLSTSNSLAQSVGPTRLTEADAAIVRQVVADETMLPERTRVLGLAASNAVGGGTYVCGLASWIDGSGTYSPNWPFVGLLADNTSNQRVFILVNLARTDREFLGVMQVCEEQDAEPGRQPPPAQEVEGDAEALLTEVREMQDRCTGPEGAVPGAEVCMYRDSLAASLNDLGWCWGMEGEPLKLADWHHCTAGSLQAPRY